MTTKKTILILTTLLLALSLIPLSEAALSDGVIAAWNMSNNNSNTDMIKMWNGTTTGGVVPCTSSPDGACFNFTASTSYATTGGLDETPFSSGNLSFAFLYRLKSTPDTGVWLLGETNGGATDMNYRTISGPTRAQVGMDRSGGGVFFNANNNEVGGVWQSVVCVSEQNVNISCWRNGVLDGSAANSNSGFANWREIYLGAVDSGGSGSLGFAGLMDNMIMWNRSLSGAEVQEVNSSLLAGDFYPFAANTPPNATVLSSPANNACVGTASNSSLIFNWALAYDVENDNINYQFILNQNSSNPTTQITAGINLTSYTYNFNFSDGDYFWKVYTNDTIDFNVSSTFRFCVDTRKATLNVASPSAGSYWKDPINLNYTISNLGNASTDKCSFINVTGGLLTDATCSNTTISMGSTSGQYNISIRQNDTSNNLVNSTIQVWVDLISPQELDVPARNESAIRIGQSVIFSMNWTDNLNLSYVVFSWNNSGSFVNDTREAHEASLNIGNTEVQVNKTKTVTQTKGKDVGFLWYAVDRANNTATGSFATFTVQNTLPIITINSPPDNDTDMNASLIVNFTYVDADGDASGICNFFVNNTIRSNVTTITNNTSALVQANLTGNASFSYRIDCADSGFGAATSTSGNRTYTVDTINPTFANCTYPSATNNSVIADFNFTIACTPVDANPYGQNVSITNGTGSVIFSNGSLNLTNYYPWLNFINLSNQTADQTFTVEYCANDDHTFGDLKGLNYTKDSKSSKNTSHILRFGTPFKTDLFNLSTGEEQQSGKITPLNQEDLNISIGYDTLRKEFKWNYSFIVPSNNFILSVLLHSDYKIDYRSPVTGVAGHFVINQSYYVDFQKIVDEGYSVAVQKISDNDYIIKILGNWKKDDYIVMDPVSGGLNTFCSFRTVDLDRTPPTFTVQSPAIDSFWNQSNITINWTASDAHLDGCMVQNSTDDYAILSGCTNTTIVLPEGRTELTLEANDSVDNFVTIVRNVTIDLTNPSLSIARPVNASYIDTTVQSTGTLNYTASDTNRDKCVIINVTGQTNVNAGCVNVTANFAGLPDSVYNVTVKVNDSAGRQTNETKYFTIDTTNPVMTVQSPLNASFFSGSSISLSFTPFDTNRDVCKLLNQSNSTAIAFSCDNATFTATEGRQTINITVNDSVSRQNSSIITFTVDLTDPFLSIEIPINNSFINYPNLLGVNFTASDTNRNACILYNITGGTHVHTNCENHSTNDLGTLGVNDGFYNITVKVNDSAGRQTNATSFFTIDTRAPIILTNFNHSMNSTNFTISLAFNESANTSIYLSLRPNMSSAGRTNGNNTFATAYNITIANLNGSVTYYYNVTSTDKAGNVNSSQTFNITMVAPAVPTGGGGGTGSSGATGFECLNDFACQAIKGMEFACINSACVNTSLIPKEAEITSCGPDEQRVVNPAMGRSICVKCPNNGKAILKDNETVTCLVCSANQKLVGDQCVVEKVEENKNPVTQILEIVGGGNQVLGLGVIAIISLFTINIAGLFRKKKIN